MSAIVSINAITSHTSQYVKPSIFDLVAQESMSEIILPAFKKIIYYLSLKNPEKYGWMVKWADECYLFFNILLQKFYLVNCGSSFSEFIYKLKRTSIYNNNNNNNSYRLPWKQEMLSLFFLTLFPYIKIKLKNYLEKKNEENEIEGERELLLKKILKTSFFLSSTSSLLYYIFYISDQIETHSPLLRLSGVVLTYVDEDSPYSNRFINYMSRLFQIGALTVQFLQSRYSEDYNMKIKSNSIPPPPKKFSNKIKSNVCGMCKKKCIIPTVLGTSGYMFCFECIANYLKRTSQCPITKLPSTIEDLIEVFST